MKRWKDDDWDESDERDAEDPLCVTDSTPASFLKIEYNSLAE